MERQNKRARRERATVSELFHAAALKGVQDGRNDVAIAHAAEAAAKVAAAEARAVKAQALAGIGTVPKWLQDAIDSAHQIIDLSWFRAPSRRNSWTGTETPARPFTFTVPAGTYDYVFEYADDELDDINGEGYDVCAGAWDGNYGTNYEHPGLLAEHFDFIVTKNAAGQLSVEVRLATSPLALATALLDDGIRVNELDQ